MNWKVYSVRQVRPYRFMITVVAMDDRNEPSLNAEGEPEHSLALPFGTIYKKAPANVEAYAEFEARLKAAIADYEAGLQPSETEQMVKAALDMNIRLDKK